MCPRSDTHFTCMINIALTTEFVLSPRGAWPDRAQRRGAGAFGGSFAVFPERNQCGGMRAGQCLPVGGRHRLRSASPGRPWRAGPLLTSRNAGHL
jgi:hypothetical protein